MTGYGQKRGAHDAFSAEGRQQGEHAKNARRDGGGNRRSGFRGSDNRCPSEQRQGGRLDGQAQSGQAHTGKLCSIASVKQPSALQLIVLAGGAEKSNMVQTGCNLPFSYKHSLARLASSNPSPESMCALCLKRCQSQRSIHSSSAMALPMAATLALVKPAHSFSGLDTQMQIWRIPCLAVAQEPSSFACVMRVW